jgi:putative ABC transport system substrate-binding protein
VRHLPLTLLLWLCHAMPASAQSAENLPLVGVLRLNTRENVEPFPTVFRNALAALGQVDGRNIRIELRLAEGHPERFPELARALVRENATVIFASGDAATRAAQQATRTIPIVAVVDDIVAAGLIDSLAKPGGNTTGVSILANELDAKRLEIMRQILPSGRRFAVLNDPTSASAQSELLAGAGRVLGVELRVVDVHTPADFAPAFAAIQGGDSEAIVLHSSPLLFGFRDDLCRLSVSYKLPAIGQSREMAEAGCLMSYGIRIADAYVMAAGLTDKMLRGARPGETPAEQPNKFELVINLKTAKALGLTVPQSLIAGADEVIE